MKNSKFFRLNGNDFLKGLITAFIIATLTAIMQGLTTIPPTIQWKSTITAGIVAMIGYLIKQLTTNSDGEPMRLENDTLSIGIGSVGTSGTKEKPKVNE